MDIYNHFFPNECEHMTSTNENIQVPNLFHTMSQNTLLNKTVPEKMVKPAIACLQYVKNKFENRKLERIIEDGYDVVKNVFNQLIITIEDILTKAILKIILRRNGINGYCKIICKTATTLKLSSLENNEEIEMKAQLISDDIKSGEKILI